REEVGLPGSDQLQDAGSESVDLGGGDGDGVTVDDDFVEDGRSRLLTRFASGEHAMRANGAVLALSRDEEYASNSGEFTRQVPETSAGTICVNPMQLDAAFEISNR
ncbi:hypothetical protein, partial [Microbacterium sp. HJ5]